MQLLIDGDLIAFRCAASVGEDGSEEIAVLRSDRLMQDLLHSTEADTYQVFLTGSNNFRRKVNPEYKANRKDKVPPAHLQACREYLVKEWHALVSDGCEADDLLGINQTEDSTIASLDKDLLMIPGWHFNWLHNEKKYVVPEDGIKTFYKQMLIGDRSDNIFGVDKIGKVKAERYIEPLETEEDMICQVLDLYGTDILRFLMNAQCLWIMQNEGETWVQRTKHLTLPAPLQLEVARMLDSMTYSMGATSTEPTTNPVKISGIAVVGILPDSMPISEVL